MRSLILDPIVLPLLIAVFIIYLFLITRHSHHQKIAFILEKSTIILLFILLLKPTIPPLTYLQLDALAGSDKSAASSILQLIIYSFFVIENRQLFRNFLESFCFLFSDLFLGLLLVLALLSALWSETPVVSFRFSLVQLLVSWLAAHFARRYNWQEISKYVCWMGLISGILSALVALAFPSIGLHEKGWQGVFPFPIKLGTCMALSIAIWLIQPMNSVGRRIVAIAAITGCLVLLVLSNSAQAIFTLMALCGLIGLLQILRKFHSRQISIVLISLIFILVFFYWIISSNLELIFAFFGKDMTLTGRTEFWPQMLATLDNRPILGYGVQGFWQSWRGEANPAGHILNAGGFVPPNGHNGFLDLAMELGWLGLIIFACSFALNLFRAITLWKRSNLIEATFPLTALLFAVMANISESQLFIAYYVWFLYVLVAVKLNSSIRTSV
jgi:exopolysaccharide production protein ExoQ